jgi:hypothetical protein
MTSIKQKVWNRLLGERSWVAANGSWRERERFDLVSRPNYAYGLLRAADLALYFGHEAVTVCEFGVASGAGLLNMIELADSIGRETGVRFRIVGFDTGAGLPSVQGHKDHPEIWSGGDFKMEARETLVERIGGRAELVFGDIGDTVDGFVRTLQPDAPIGFVSVDVDIYSGSQSALRVLRGPVASYLPAISMYFDDVSFFFANDWCGELASIHEFNAESETRKIGIDRSLPGARPILAPWHRGMYVCHFFDHDARQRPRDRQALTIDAHHSFMRDRFLY